MFKERLTCLVVLLLCTVGFLFTGCGVSSDYPIINVNESTSNAVELEDYHYYDNRVIFVEMYNDIIYDCEYLTKSELDNHYDDGFISIFDVDIPSLIISVFMHEPCRNNISRAIVTPSRSRNIPHVPHDRIDATHFMTGSDRSYDIRQTPEFIQQFILAEGMPEFATPFFRDLLCLHKDISIITHSETHLIDVEYNLCIGVYWQYFMTCYDCFAMTDSMTIKRRGCYDNCSALHFHYQQRWGWMDAE